MTPLADRVAQAAAFLQPRLEQPPRIGVVLGSGWSSLAERLPSAPFIDYHAIPGFPTTSVAGHAGRLLFASVAGSPTAILQGRFHYYEGHDLATVTLPVRVLAALGVRTLILTAATGGIDPALRPGQVVALADHINLLGANPLRGPDDPRLGPRFPDMSAVYSLRLRSIARDAAASLELDLPDAIYAALPGPSYETPAEIAMLRTLGASVVGMSTVPEAIVARQLGLEVLGLALVTNPAAGVSSVPLDHQDVLAVGRASAHTLASLLEAILARIHTPG